MIDQIDLKILSILQNSGRSRLADIAEEVVLSAPAVFERVKKLEANGVIKGYQALLDGKKVGKDITAFIGVSIGNQQDIDKFATQMLRNPDVLECHHITGDESFILKVKSANTTSLEKLLGEIRSVQGVTRTVTRVVLSTAKESQMFDLSEGITESQNYDQHCSVIGRTKNHSDRKLSINQTMRTQQGTSISLIRIRLQLPPGGLIIHRNYSLKLQSMEHR
jgi:Lrp/AsnC family leucine-responsive transcriptional regulator